MILSNHKGPRSQSGRKCHSSSRCCQKENGRCVELHGASICDGMQVVVVVVDVRITIVVTEVAAQAGVVAEVIVEQRSTVAVAVTATVVVVAAVAAVVAVMMMSITKDDVAVGLLLSMLLTLSLNLCYTDYR